jgi:hypothetical protein
MARNRPIDIDEIAYMQERVVKQKATGPAVYLRLDPARPDSFYLGKSFDPSERVHTNATHFLARAYATATKEDCVKLETALHNRFLILVENGELRRYREGTKGLYGGCSENPLDFVDRIILQDYRPWCRAIIGF